MPHPNAAGVGVLHSESAFRVPGGPARGRDRGDRDCSRIKTSDRSPRGSGRRHASASQSTRDPAFSRKADYGALGLMESAFRQSLFFSTFQEEAKIECCRQRCLCRSAKRSLVVPVGPAGYDQRFSFTPMDAGSRRYLRLAAKRSYRARRAWATAGGHRSEEHTSELQSRGHLVCRLLLEKKKKKDT